MVEKADVLIVTVTKVESRAVLEAFREATGKEAQRVSIGDRIYHHLGEVNGARVFMTVSGMGSGGVGGAQKAVDKGIEALSPSAVIMAGIAFGINEKKQAIGDILVSEHLMLYDLQRVGTDQAGQLEIILRGSRPDASSWLVNLFKSVDLYWDDTKAKVRFGVVLSGDKLVDNFDYREQLKQFEPEAIGGEMEGAGMYVASQDKKVDWILVKAICDWADGNKGGPNKDANQATAAHNAAAYVFYALQFATVNWQEKRREAEQTAQVLTNTGPGPVAATGGVASGAGGASVGGDVYGNVIRKPRKKLRYENMGRSSKSKNKAYKDPNITIVRPVGGSIHSGSGDVVISVDAERQGIVEHEIKERKRQETERNQEEEQQRQEAKAEFKARQEAFRKKVTVQMDKDVVK
jgi:nucleoside phosphorylase